MMRGVDRAVNERSSYAPRVRVIGLMSGTSADGVDAALVEWPEGMLERPLHLLRVPPGSASARAPAADPRSRRRAVPAGEVLAELAGLDVELGERFAASAAALAEDAGVALSEIDAIASHGQTVAHHPARRATLQIGDPSVIAERTGCTTVADFRPRDLALGGEGAPLAPFFHHAAFADPPEGRGVLNLGGIANLTWLPRGGRADDVIAFDIGPANTLIDGVVRAFTGGREAFDRDGARAARGDPDAELLARLLDDAFLRRPPPKSTGRERYGLAEAEALVREWRAAGRREEDLVATLVAFSVEAIRRAPVGIPVAGRSDGAAAGRRRRRGESGVDGRARARACASARSSRWMPPAYRRAPARRWPSRCWDATRCSGDRIICRAAPAPAAPACSARSSAPERTSPSALGRVRQARSARSEPKASEVHSGWSEAPRAGSSGRRPRSRSRTARVARSSPSRGGSGPSARSRTSGLCGHQRLVVEVEVEAGAW